MMIGGIGKRDKERKSWRDEEATATDSAGR